MEDLEILRHARPLDASSGEEVHEPPGWVAFAHVPDVVQADVPLVPMPPEFVGKAPEFEMLLQKKNAFARELGEQTATGHAAHSRSDDNGVVGRVGHAREQALRVPKFGMA